MLIFFDGDIGGGFVVALVEGNRWGRFIGMLALPSTFEADGGIVDAVALFIEEVGVEIVFAGVFLRRQVAHTYDTPIALAGGGLSRDNANVVWLGVVVASGCSLGEGEIAFVVLLEIKAD